MPIIQFYLKAFMLGSLLITEDLEQAGSVLWANQIFYRNKIVAWCLFNRKTLSRYFLSSLNEFTESRDTESAHAKADDLLCDLLDLLGYNEVVSTYYSVPKWYS